MSASHPSEAPPGASRARASARKRHALALFRGLPARYDRLSALLSFGQDPRWRRALVDSLGPLEGRRVLDVATGTGLVAAELLARGCRDVVALDQSAEMLAGARARFAALAAGQGDARVTLVAGEAEALPFADASFDALTFTYLLRYVDDPAATMRELARVLRPGARIASLEFGVPPWAPARRAWRLYTGVGLPLLGRLASREWAQVGRFLGPSIEGFYERHHVERVTDYWRAAGLEGVSVRRMSLGGAVLMSARRGASSHGEHGERPIEPSGEPARERARDASGT